MGAKGSGCTLNAAASRILKRLAGCGSSSEPWGELPGVLGGLMTGDVGGDGAGVHGGVDWLGLAAEIAGGEGGEILAAGGELLARAGGDADGFAGVDEVPLDLAGHVRPLAGF